MSAPKLSIVVVTFRMQREAPRTIASLLPPLQRCVDDLDYEIVVIDNGSPQPLDLGNTATAAAARPVRLVRVAPEDASASPASCINRAVREHTTGDWLMVCIDGGAPRELAPRPPDRRRAHPAPRRLHLRREPSPRPQAADAVGQGRLRPGGRRPAPRHHPLEGGPRPSLLDQRLGGRPRPEETRCSRTRATRSRWPARPGMHSAGTTKASPAPVAACAISSCSTDA